MKPRSPNNWIGAAIAFGVALGAIAGALFGRAMDDVGPWLTVGVVTGAAVGAAMALIWRG